MPEPAHRRDPGEEPDFRTLFESAPGLYLVLDPALRIVAATDAYLRATLKVRSEILGRDVFEVFPDNPDDPTAGSARDMRASVERVLALGTPDVLPLARHDIRRPEPDEGFEEKYWSATNTPLLGEDGRVRHIIHRVEDVTEFVLLHQQRGGPATAGSDIDRMATELLQRRTQTSRLASQLKELNVELERLLEASLDPLVTMDPAGRITKVNEATVTVTGIERDDLLGTDFSDYFTEPDRARSGFRQALAEGSASGIPLTVRHRDGGSTAVLYNASVYRDSGGGVLGVFAAARDITAYQQAQEEIAAQRMKEDRRALEAQLEQARRLEAVGRLAGGVAHDFNNILTVVLGHAADAGQLLQKHLASGGGQDAGVRRALADVEEVHAAGERAAALIRQLLTFAHRDAIRPEVVDLNDVVRGLATFLRRTLGEHIHLRSWAGDTPLPVLADRARLEQIVVNLSVNARDAMPGGGTLTVETARVTSDDIQPRLRSDSPAGDYVRLTVADSGSGMEPEALDRAFEPFFSTKPEGQGTGLGLATVYGIVTEAGGSVELTSHPGEGTVVTVHLPMTAAAAACPADSTEPTTGGDLGGTVLLVEDDKKVRLLVARILAGAGYTVLPAGHPSEALAICADHARPVDLLLTDVVMPEMSGPDLARQVRAQRPEVQVVYMSGYLGDAPPGPASVTDDAVIVKKPFRAESLLGALREARRGRTTPGQGREEGG